jgi:hypothetical protein
MAGLVPAINALIAAKRDLIAAKKDLDARDEPAHDVSSNAQATP